MLHANFTVNNQLSPQQVKLNKLIKSLLIVLSEKEKYIIESRFSLQRQKRQTLEEIGKNLGVTRERVRQIEKNALHKLKRSAQNTNIKILTEFVKALLEKEGGLAKDRYFKGRLMKILPNITKEELHDLHLALILDQNISFESNTLKYHPYWRLKDIKSDLVNKVSDSAIAILQANKHVMSADEIKKVLNKNLKMNLSTSTLRNILDINKECKFTEDGIGLYSWRHIHPRTLRDKILYILQGEKKPLHFTKIASKIRDANFDAKRVNLQAVHNELIRNEDFVLIGRGLYALKKWGYKTGTVADIIKDILKDGVARTREEISKEVLKQRQVKTITIYLNLKNKPDFIRVGRDKYTLAKFDIM